MEGVKSGEEIVSEFFNSIEEIPSVDIEVAILLKDLYGTGKLTQTYLSNALLKMREDAGNVEN